MFLRGRGLRPNLILWTQFSHALLLQTDTVYHPLEMSSQGVYVEGYMNNLVAKTFGFTPTFSKLFFFSQNICWRWGMTALSYAMPLDVGRYVFFVQPLIIYHL